MPCVYKIVYPNGKIYVGKDATDSINYFGSASSEQIAKDFTPEQRRSFAVTREILWETPTCSSRELHAKEMFFIRLLNANQPSVGYNRTPKP